MAKVKFELNREGVRQLLKGDAMQSLLSDKASQAANRAGSGYKSDLHVGVNRANASVFADTYEAERDNLKNNTILKSLQ